MAAPMLVQSPKVQVDSQPLDQAWANRMISLSLEMQFQVPTRLTLRFAIPVLGQVTAPFKFTLNERVSVALPSVRPDGGTSFVQPCGDLFVTEIGAERDGADVGELVVVAHDASFRMTRRNSVTTFVEMTASAVAKKVALGAGLAPGTVDATSDVIPYLLQADSDFGFVTTLARRCGYDWWVDGLKFNFAKPPSSPPTVTTSVQEDLLRFSVSQSAVANPEVTVNGWDRDRQTKVTGTARPGTLPTNKVLGMANAAGGVEKASTLTTAAVRAGSDAEAESIAQAITDSQVAASIEAQGEMLGNPNVRPGVKIVVTGDHLGGDYLVTRVEHRYTGSGFTTRFIAGDRNPSGLADLLGSGSLPQHFGSHTNLPALIPAVVTAIGKGDHLGRVKVKFPYLSDNNSSHWARVLSAGGGPERGFWFLPEVDDEVLVAFEGGDSRFPVVMGGLYGKVTTPEDQLLDNGQIASRSVRSRLGHFMEFVDGSEETKRHISFGLGKGGKAGTDYKLRIGEDRFDIEVPEGKPISIKAGATQITFTDQKAIEITGENVTVKATDTLTLEGKKVEVKGTQDLSVSQGSNKVTMGAGGLEVKGAPSTTIKGGPKVSIG